jgi:hypothetical protein
VLIFKNEFNSVFLKYLASYNNHLFSTVDNQENGGAVSGALRCAKKSAEGVNKQNLRGILRG